MPCCVDLADDRRRCAATSIGREAHRGSSSRSSAGGPSARGRWRASAARRPTACRLLARAPSAAGRGRTRGPGRPGAARRGAGTRPSRGSRAPIMRGKMRRPSGTWDAQAHDLVRRGSAPIGSPVEADRALAAGASARRSPAGSSSCRAVGADERDDLALLDRERDALERLDARRSRCGRRAPRAAPSGQASSPR